MLSSCTTQVEIEPDQPELKEVRVIECQDAIQAPDDGCAVSPIDGTFGGSLIQGTILLPNIVIHDGIVAWNASGVIQHVGCSSEIDTSSFQRISCGNTVISPGLINSHDHIEWNHASPIAPPERRYDIRGEWRRGTTGKQRIVAEKDDSFPKVAWTELRQVMAGTTTVVGGGGVKGLLRNADVIDLQEGLSVREVDYNIFPLADSESITYLTESCDYPGIIGPDELQSRSFLGHIGEGVNAASHNEILCLTGRGTNPKSRGVDLTSENSAFVHAIPLTDKDAAVLASTNTSVIWSPRSNIALYGNTAPVTLLKRMGVNVALATDWVPTGSMNLRRELACATEFNVNQLGGYLSDQDLWEMVTANASQAIGYSREIGVFAKGALADIVAVESNGNTYSAVWSGSPSTIRIVLRAGVPLYGDEDLMNKVVESCEKIEVCGARKSVCVESEIGKNFSWLRENNRESYGLYYCGTLPSEPTCVPSRPGQYPRPRGFTSDDADGDGVPLQIDNCPAIFNPIRPMDGQAQPAYFCAEE